ncbi:MAG TPA: hypothetical protein H9850_03655, partial [Candidatus Anaerobiospirillum pullistercoris]|nr:hypothetical protein [Candidatus Anaerobiospirillum pullistercoris]
NANFLLVNYSKGVRLVDSGFKGGFACLSHYIPSAQVENFNKVQKTRAKQGKNHPKEIYIAFLEFSRPQNKQGSPKSVKILGSPVVYLRP